MFTAVTMKNVVFWDVTPCGYFKKDLSEERIAPIIRVTRIGVLGTALAVTNNCSTQRVSVSSYC
jgi:hypothetical protein